MWGLSHDSTTAIQGMLFVKCSSKRHGSLCLDLLYALGVMPWMFTVRRVDEGRLLEGCRGLGSVSVGLFGGVMDLECGFGFVCGLLAGTGLRISLSFLLSLLFPLLFLPSECLLLSPLKKTDLLYLILAELETCAHLEVGFQNGVGDIAEWYSCGMTVASFGEVGGYGDWYLLDVPGFRSCVG